ncbi:MAG: T9SS type A sorting domain-containing protein [Ignavibacteria bacterium]|nr:T9SS type A sorting domain-containing protein [Ignavibacteria bacterium]
MSGYNGVFVGQVAENAGTYTFTVPDEMTECTYYFHATRNVAGQPLTSAYATTPITTAGTGVASPIEVRAVSNQSGRTSVSWRMSPGNLVNGFLIYVRDSEGVDSLYATAFAEDRLVMIDIVNHAAKQIVIIAFDKNGSRGCATQALPITTGIEEEQYVVTGENSQIDASIVPNPTNGHTTIRFTCGADVRASATIDIITVVGQKIATLIVADPSTGWNQVEWDARGVNAGTYYVRIEHSNGQAIVPIVVVK